METMLSISTGLVLAALAALTLLRPRKGLDDPRVRERDARFRKIARMLFPAALVLVALSFFINRR